MPRSGRKNKWWRSLTCCTPNESASITSYDLTDLAADASSDVTSCDESRTRLSMTCFERALRQADLLDTSALPYDHPVLNLCLGFTNRELNHQKHHYVSYEQSNLDRAVAIRIQNLFYSEDDLESSDEPLIDELPASIWYECVEPTLYALISLNNMKHRRTNLTQHRIGTDVDSVEDNETNRARGDRPMFVFPGPHQAGFMVLQIRDRFNGIGPDLPYHMAFPQPMVSININVK